MEPIGLEPTTYWLQTSEPADVNPCQTKAGVPLDGARCTVGCTNSPETASKPASMSNELARVVAAWPSLSEPVRVGILAMVESVTKGASARQWHKVTDANRAAVSVSGVLEPHPDP